MKLLRPLRERDFALLWAGMTVSLLGDGIFLVPEAWQVYDIDNDPSTLAAGLRRDEDLHPLLGDADA